MFDWDDLRVFLAASRAGTLGEASKRLGIDAATVGRRIARLETALRSTLLVRSPSGTQLTATGAQLLELSLDVEASIEAAARVTQPNTISGTVRISTAEGFGVAVLAPALPSLIKARPGLKIELAASSGFLSPSSREVDMAITLSPPKAQRLVVEPLTYYELGLYASADYLKREGKPRTVEDLKSRQVVGYVDDLVYAPELKYLDEVLPGLAPTLSSSSIQAQKSIIEAGGGIGVLPCFLASGLTRVLSSTVVLERRFWLSTHHELSKVSRIRAVQTWLKALVRQEKSTLLPSHPRE